MSTRECGTSSRSTACPSRRSPSRSRPGSSTTTCTSDVVIQEKGFGQVSNPPPGFGDFQNEIYLAGLTGEVDLVLEVAESRRRIAHLTKSLLLNDHVTGAGGR